MPKHSDRAISVDLNTAPKLVSDDGKFDFSGVNFETGEGAKLEFSSIEELNAYTKAFNAMCDKLGIELKDDDEDPPRTFWNFRVLEGTTRYGVPSFSIIEVHYEDGKISGYIDTQHNILSDWETYDDLKGTWELIKGAFEMPVLRKDDKKFLYEVDKKKGNQ